MKKHLRRYYMLRTAVVSILALLFLTACGPTVRVTGSWMNEPALRGKSYQTIFLALLSPRVESRAVVEQDLQNAFGEKGIQVIKSSDIFPPNYKPETEAEKNEALERIRSEGAQAIMTVALKDTKSETYYVPGTTSYIPTAYPFYGSYWGYYGNTYQRVYEPGYYGTSQTYFLEANLFDINSLELLWSAQSEAYDPGSLKRFSREYTKTLRREMQEQGLID